MENICTFVCVSVLIIGLIIFCLRPTIMRIKRILRFYKEVGEEVDRQDLNTGLKGSNCKLNIEPKVCHEENIGTLIPMYQVPEVPISEMNSPSEIVKRHSYRPGSTTDGPRSTPNGPRSSPNGPEFNRSEIVKTFTEKKASNENSVQPSGKYQAPKIKFVETLEVTDMNTPAVRCKNSIQNSGENSGEYSVGLYCINQVPKAECIQICEQPKKYDKGYITCDSVINGNHVMNFAGLS